MHCTRAMTLDVTAMVPPRKYSGTSIAASWPFDRFLDVTVRACTTLRQQGQVWECEFLNVCMATLMMKGNAGLNTCDFSTLMVGQSAEPSVRVSTAKGAQADQVLLDDGELGGRKRWFNILGLSKLDWAVALTAIQRRYPKVRPVAFTVSLTHRRPFSCCGRFGDMPYRQH